MNNDKLHNVICPVCGFTKKSTEMKKRWDGLWVCGPDWEARHPVDFINIKAEDVSVPYSYPDEVAGTETTVSTSTWTDTLTTVPTPPTDTL